MVPLHSLRYVIVVQKRIDNLYEWPQGYHRYGEYVLLSPTYWGSPPFPGHRSTTTYNYGEKFSRAFQSLAHVVGRCLVFPCLVAEAVGQAGPVFVANRDIGDHELLPLFDHQIWLLEVAGYRWLKKVEEPFRKFIHDVVLNLVMSPNALRLRMEAHIQDVPNVSACILFLRNFLWSMNNHIIFM